MERANLSSLLSSGKNKAVSARLARSSHLMRRDVAHLTAYFGRDPGGEPRRGLGTHDRSDTVPVMGKLLEKASRTPTCQDGRRRTARDTFHRQGPEETQGFN